EYNTALTVSPADLFAPWNSCPLIPPFDLAVPKSLDNDSFAFSAQPGLPFWTASASPLSSTSDFTIETASNLDHATDYEAENTSEMDAFNLDLDDTQLLSDFSSHPARILEPSASYDLLPQYDQPSPIERVLRKFLDDHLSVRSPSRELLDENYHQRTQDPFAIVSTSPSISPEPSELKWEYDINVEFSSHTRSNLVKSKDDGEYFPSSNEESHYEDDQKFFVLPSRLGHNKGASTISSGFGDNEGASRISKRQIRPNNAKLSASLQATLNNEVLRFPSLPPEQHQAHKPSGHKAIELSTTTLSDSPGTGARTSVLSTPPSVVTSVKAFKRKRQADEEHGGDSDYQLSSSQEGIATQPSGTRDKKKCQRRRVNPKAGDAMPKPPELSSDGVKQYQLQVRHDTRKCPFCSAGPFCGHQEVSRHLTTHGPPGYPCKPECGKAYGRRDALIRHQRDSCKHFKAGKKSLMLPTIDDLSKSVSFDHHFFR
ncbi:hypothetical protein H0H87_000254, partial [Tephrocybe sp. NHM501043]